MKTKEEIVNDFINSQEDWTVGDREMYRSESGRDAINLRSYFEDLVEFTLACQSDQQPVDLGINKTLLKSIETAYKLWSDNKIEDWDFSVQMHNFLIIAYEKASAIPAEDKEAFAVGFVKWIGRNVVDDLENGIDKWQTYDERNLTTEDLLHLYKTKINRHDPINQKAD